MLDNSHSYIEDLFALLCSGLFVSFGVYLFQVEELMVGGAAGLALLGTYATDLSWGTLFFLINLPFYALAWTQIGKRFTINTFISVTSISILSEYVPNLVTVDHIHPVFAAMMGGVLIGMGILIMFRHASSLGGLGILAFYLQNRFGIKAGTFQLAIDSLILLCSAIYISWPLVTISVLAAFFLNMVLSLNHRPDRYSLQAKADTEAKTA
ncbi:YitT family protein [Parendozoicomonas haliclonae]|uniref:YitT family protein n=1 Tax=Parendozoicomonas haliclonae TaxID=1960125 RepID=A0A1X7APD8_9GAMM|nr:YitT family protein [Parendozoicomonas haliclonae]SMA50191.1 hypothetical protein EHSB41UT_03984 [Parendozoicomonas haliclonae]